MLNLPSTCLLTDNGFFHGDIYIILMTKELDRCSKSVAQLLHTLQILYPFKTVRMYMWQFVRELCMGLPTCALLNSLLQMYKHQSTNKHGLPLCGSRKYHSTYMHPMEGHCMENTMGKVFWCRPQSAFT